MKQRQKFKSIRGKVTTICINISREFCTICQKLNNKSKSSRMRAEKMLKCQILIVSVSC